MKIFKYIVAAFILGLIFFSCKKETFITSKQALLNVSSDTLFYDTVFVSAGSVTQSFKIFNNNDQKLRLSKVKLIGGTTSAFKMNVDGASTIEADNIEIAANDSIYVFVQVNVNPTAANLPFVIRDSILINYNGNNKYVQLQAYGQNANFLRSKKLTGNIIWTSILPYVIVGGLQIDTTATLTIQAGTKIYSHANAPFLVDGTLIINGTKQSPVIFTGDRLDADYKDLPASWPGISFRPTSKNNSLTFAVIKNAYQAIVAQNLSVNTSPKLKISQCIIDNAYDAGILGINTNIYADNSLITNCGSNMIFALGGDYQFTHCTVAAYSNIFVDHKNPVLQVSNFITQNNQTTSASLNAIFKNCIFWGEGGNVDNEIIVLKQGTSIFNVTLDHIFYKALNDPTNATILASIKNQLPLFDSINTSKQFYDFRFTKNANAPAINKGVLTAFPKDLDDKPRANGIPDIGSYEK
jgi:predicted secreted protein